MEQYSEAGQKAKEVRSLKRTELDFVGVSFREVGGLSNSVNYNSLPAYSPGKELVKKWKVRQTIGRIYDCLRADWSDTK